MAWGFRVLGFRVANPKPQLLEAHGFTSSGPGEFRV